MTAEDGQENETNSLSGVHSRRGVGRDGWEHVGLEALAGGL